MTLFSRRRSGSPGAKPKGIQVGMDDLLLSHTPAVSVESADCCVAPARYRVVLPANDLRQQPATLLMCGHHLHQSQTALRARNAIIYDADPFALTLAGR